jgi:hypothetical protein
MCQNRLRSGTYENVSITSLICCSFGFGRVMTTIACRHIGRCRNADLAAVSNARFFHEEAKSCTRLKRQQLWAADDSVHIVGKRECKNPEFGRNI